MATLAMGAGAARLVGLVSIPILTRIYDPGHFGILATFTALLALLSPVTTLRYTMAIPLPRHDGMAINLAALSLLLLGISSMAISSCLWLLGPVILPPLSMDTLVPYWWLLGLGLLGTGAYEILQTWAIRRTAYKPIAQTQLLQSGLGSAAKIGLGLLDWKPLGLLIGQVIASGAGTGRLCRHFWTDLRKHRRFVTLSRVKFAFARYRDFPVYRLPSQFLLVFSAQAPILFVAALYDKETTGQLGLALTALALPIALFGNTAAQAYYGEIARVGKRDPDEIYQITKSLVRNLLLLGIFPFLLLLLLGPALFETVFGDPWREAGVFASVLAVYLMAQFVSAPLINVISVLGRQRFFLATNVRRVILIASTFAVAKWRGLDAISAILLYSIVLAIHYLLVSKAVFGVMHESRQRVH